ncbi:UDP-N-acetylmuramoyl-tripeptide--D-alanyl-D-alanine ligase [Flavihumibacter petaseus]|uniref:UDP-N-acetylmuramoyl-tripeptide--D-alanyl-D-alanine ligase n=1 Tax=Flavihumibacter petaseus NBRC 106054 TaxID=1220578 RepID=A0A0E9MWY8_9BACT|nr:UDP-N-acetylmuramoyl-tripeptide--D-alanyl-D-alanine ligase [Flavihumibacter petaseus]GAO41635.1 UDP-N-acetylmuramoyl-tripeptide--D-alanyl-D-alanine ligase [Flavihumibacter petaseus NBRC 106054]
MTIEALYEIYLAHPSIQTDTRKLKQGDLFFALKGDQFNGNSFANAALETGAAFAIIDEPEYHTGNRTIVVSNVLETLQALALHHRRQFNIPFLAITGSNGKTTTKELIHTVLSRKFRTSTTEGNLNNHIGIPLTLLKIPAGTEMAVIEMGANHQHEIESYCLYTEPTHGLITNLGKAHLEGFGGVEGVRKGKGELFAYLRSHGGTTFVFGDDPWLPVMASGTETVLYGSETAEAATSLDFSVSGHVIQSEPFLEVAARGITSVHSIRTQLVGAYNLPNVLAAVAVGKFFGVPGIDIVAAIAGYKPENSRSQLVHWQNNQVILDAYNANPSSMRAAIENFAHLPGNNKVLLLGAMAELGEESLREHENIVSLIAGYPWKAVVLVGGDFGRIGHPFLQLSDSEAARDWLKTQQLSNSFLLVKGSRSMRMEKVLAE